MVRSSLQIRVFLLWQYTPTLELSEVGKCTPCGPHKNSPPSDFYPRRWLLSNPEGFSNKKPVVSAINPTFKTGFCSFGSGMRVCLGKDLAEVEILMVLSSTLCTFVILQWNILSGLRKCRMSILIWYWRLEKIDRVFNIAPMDTSSICTCRVFWWLIDSCYWWMRVSKACYHLVYLCQWYHQHRINNVGLKYCACTLLIM